MRRWRTGTTDGSRAGRWGGRLRPVDLLTLIWVGFFGYLTLWPRPPRPSMLGPFGDATSAHLWASAITGLLLCLSLAARVGTRRPRRLWLTAGLVAGGVGALFEVLQSLVPERTTSLWDAVANLAGGLSGALIGVLAIGTGARTAMSRVAAAGTTAALVATAAVVGLSNEYSPDVKLLPGWSRPSPAWDPVTGPDRCVEALAAYPAGARAAPALVDAGARPVVRYDFSSGAGGRVSDLSGSADPVDLSIIGDITVDGSAHLPGGESRLSARDVDLAGAVTRAGALAIEVTVRPLADQAGPARVVSVSGGTGEYDVNVHLAQNHDALSLRLRTSCEPAHWFMVPDVFAVGETRRITAAFAEETLRVAVDGDLRLEVRFRPGIRLAGWSEDFSLLVGNEIDGLRPFEGDVSELAIYTAAAPAQP